MEDLLHGSEAALVEVDLLKIVGEFIALGRLSRYQQGRKEPEQV